MRRIMNNLYTHFLLLCFLLVVFSGCADGQNGKDGLPGAPGRPGQDCDVVQVYNGAIITCGSFSAIILNGQDAVPSSYTIVEIIDPCGDNPGQFDEVIFRLADGSLITHYSDTNLHFLTVLSPGNYRTTDKQSCRFNVSSSLAVTW